MKSTKWTRRQVLKGAGVALSVPWLETFAPKKAHAAGAVRRYLSFYWPNGTASAYWTPGGAGTSFTLSPIQQPLEPNKAKLLILGNVGNYSPWNGHIEPSHGHNSATAWTGVRAHNVAGKTETNYGSSISVDQGKTETNYGSSISVDQVIANTIQAQNGGMLPTPVHSLQLGLSTLDSYTDGLPGPHSRSMSWKSEGEPLGKIISPQGAFDAIVAGGLPMGGGGTMPDPLAVRRQALKKSALDYITESSTTLKARLSRSDQTRMESFLSSVRTLEGRVTAMPVTNTNAAQNCKPVTRPTQVYSLTNVPPTYNRGDHAQVMIDLAVMAFQCDLTRVVSFMMDDARSDYVYNFLKERSFSATGSTPGTAAVGGYHGLQHTSENNNGFATISWWNMDRLNALITRLGMIQEGTGTVMDNTVIHAMSGMHGGNHDSLNLPIVIAGGAGVLKQGQYIDFGKTGVPMGGGKNLQDVHLTIINKVFGGNLTQFGTAQGMFVGTTGVINELLA
jgi:hypothetical protein